MSFINDFNSQIARIQTQVDTLYTRAKEQVLSLLDKSNSSFTELSSIFRRDTSNEDSFVDGSKIFETEGLALDKNGWTNAFTVNEVLFLDDYYQRITFPMSMLGGRVLPGSRFLDIFREREGFWGYFREDGQAVDSEFTLSFKVTPEEPTASVNRLYLRTNNDLTVEAFYRASFQDDWTSLGTRSGQHHIWSTAFTGVEVRFLAHTDLFSVSLVQAGQASFDLEGSLTSTYYEVEDLRNLTVQKDADIPLGTALRTFVHITNTPPATPPVSGLIPWEEEKLVTLAATEFAGPVASGHVIPSGYIDSSLVVRTGFEQWETVSTIDYKIVTLSVDRLGSTFLDIPSGHKVIEGGVKAIFMGNGESRTDFAEDDDYTVRYDLDNNTIQILYTNGGRLPIYLTDRNYDSPEVEPSAEVLLRQPVTVLQRRTFVLLEADGNITITIPTTNITVRTLHIGDTIEDEITVQGPPIGTYTFVGKEGLNLIEVEGYDAGNPPVLSGVYKYFSTRYRLQKSETEPPDADEYYLSSVAGGLRLAATGANLYMRYLVPTGYNHVSVRFEFEGKEDAAPLLRAYRLLNRVDQP